MASRKRLRPVAAPVDPFVTPANPGPEQDNQTWDGLLQLSNSLMQADQAYRTAEEKKQRDARIAAAEGRRLKTQARVDAPAAVEALKNVDPAVTKRYLQGEATEEDRNAVISAFHGSGVDEPNNPELVFGIRRRQVELLPSDGNYESWMMAPEFQDELRQLPESDRLPRVNERKSEWLAQQGVGPDLLPVLTGQLKNYDDQINKALHTIRVKEFDARKTDALTKEAGLVVAAIIGDDDDKEVEILKKAKAFRATLNAADKDKSDKQYKVILRERLELEIHDHDLTEEQADTIIDQLTTNGLLSESDSLELHTTVDALIHRKKQRTKDTSSLAVANQVAAAMYADALRTQQLELKRPLTNEEITNTIQGMFSEVQQHYKDNELNAVLAASAQEDALKNAFSMREVRVKDDPVTLVNLQNRLAQADINLEDFLRNALLDQKITNETYLRFSGQVRELLSPEKAVSVVRQHMSGITLPPGVDSSEISTDLVYTWQTSMGEWVDKTRALENKRKELVRQAVLNQTPEQRTDNPEYWLKQGAAGASGALTRIATATLGTEIVEATQEVGIDATQETLTYIFSTMSDEEKIDMRMMPESEQQQLLTRRLHQLKDYTQKKALNNHFDKVTKDAQMRKDLETQVADPTTEYIGSTRRVATRSFNQTFPEARRALAGGGNYSSWWYGPGLSNALDMANRFANTKENEPIENRLFTGGISSSSGRSQQRRAHYVMTRALLASVSATDADGALVLFEEYDDPKSAQKYLNAHFLNFGVPLQSIINNKHLGHDLKDITFSYNSSPYFDSREQLDANISKQEDGTWKVSDTVSQVMNVLKIDPSDAGIEKFYGAQRALTLPTDSPLYTQFRLNRNPDLDFMRKSEDGTQLLFSEGAIRTDLFKTKVLEAK
jgi:hypothetical protein